MDERAGGSLAPPHPLSQEVTTLGLAFQEQPDNFMAHKQRRHHTLKGG